MFPGVCVLFLINLYAAIIDASKCSKYIVILTEDDSCKPIKYNDINWDSVDCPRNDSTTVMTYNEIYANRSCILELDYEKSVTNCNITTEGSSNSPTQKSITTEQNSSTKKSITTEESTTTSKSITREQSTLSQKSETTEGSITTQKSITTEGSTHNNNVLIHTTAPNSTSNSNVVENSNTKMKLLKENNHTSDDLSSKYKNDDTSSDYSSTVYILLAILAIVLGIVMVFIGLKLRRPTGVYYPVPGRDRSNVEDSAL